MRRRRNFWSLAALAVMGMGCGRGGEGDEAQLLALRIRPEELSLYAGQRVAISVDGLYLERTFYGYRQKAVALENHEQLFLWTASSKIARLEEGPTLVAVAAGDTRLLAYFAGRQAELPLRVSAHPLYRIDARPDSLELELGGYRQLQVAGLLTDGSEIDLSQPAFGTTYSSADPTVASATGEGIVFCHADGRAEIAAHNREFSDTLAVKCGSGRSLYAIDLVPARLDLLAGESASLQLMGRFTDQSVEDLTSHPQTRLQVDNPQVASLQGAGLVVALSAGQTTVNAFHKQFASTAQVVVHEPKLLVDLQLSPSWLKLERGDVAQLAVRAVYLGGDLQDVTGRAVFVAADPDIAGVSAGGLVTAVGAGATSVRVSFGGRVAVCSVSVDLPGGWLELRPPAAILHPGEQLFLRAFLLRPGLPEEDITAQASFSSSSPQVAAVDAEGVVAASSAGLASILASWQGWGGASQITVQEK